MTISILSQRSPCTGVCRLSPDSGYCYGCLRNVDEISAWNQAEHSCKRQIWSELAKRRAQSEESVVVTDQLKTMMEVSPPLHRIVSLVPSITQTLYDLGLEAKVIGRTRFCPHISKPVSIGGTKDPKIDQILDLEPSVILANKEENRPEDVDDLRSFYPVWTSDVTSIFDSQDLIFRLGQLFDAHIQAEKIITEVETGLEACKNRLAGMRAAYLIWKNPYMSCGGDTYIHSIMSHLGLKNVYSSSKRYPEVKLEELKEESPDLVLLTSEPYYFRQSDQEELRRILPNTCVIRVSGKSFTWYGSQLSEACQYFNDELLDSAQIL